MVFRLRFYSIHAVMSMPDSILDAFGAGDYRYSVHFFSFYMFLFPMFR